MLFVILLHLMVVGTRGLEHFGHLTPQVLMDDFTALAKPSEVRSRAVMAWIVP